ncbi:xanthine dehydrogenase FAD-binding subunit [Desulfomicrobium norvegicum]|uniref:Xanthine dehydrogenase FAD-binding subunit n=1 Tax=Desulfomicrobium norvegicum (strain DSM 1741 / NCIMB 8310) TaxID=52561 RepID=A0A8G2F6F9_DESNO|nr:xanthine dehydrogenase family protein subunit M [Desulfomicrobium norvegicum]SFL87907.1 xanthine dehydrogenase FAD-binding subunit [Desulfomicrobium norvegicum]
MSVYLPGTLNELWNLLDEPDTAVMAGGTDYLVRRRADKSSAQICCLERIPALRGLEAQGGVLEIGAATTLTDLLESGIVTARLPMLHQAVRQLGSPLVRNQATLGGNLCTASPAGDTLPALYALGARVALLSRDAERVLDVAEFITGPGRTVLESGEILARVIIPLPDPDAVQHFEKVGRRQALAISVASMAALLHLDGDIVRDVRLAFGSVAPTVLRCPEAESWLTGRALTSGNLSHAADLVRATVRPIDDVRATADYRRQVAGNLILRLEGHRP